MGLLNDDILAQLNADDPEETPIEDKEAIDADTVRTVLYAHRDIQPPQAYAIQTQRQIVETVRWTLAMNDIYDVTTRRKAAQKLVAEHTDSPDEDSTHIAKQAVQDKVRQLFDGRFGPKSTKSAQDLFDDVLEDVEDAYNARMENR